MSFLLWALCTYFALVRNGPGPRPNGPRCHFITVIGLTGDRMNLKAASLDLDLFDLEAEALFGRDGLANTRQTRYRVPFPTPVQSRVVITNFEAFHGTRGFTLAWHTRDMCMAVASRVHVHACHVHDFRAYANGHALELCIERIHELVLHTVPVQALFAIRLDYVLSVWPGMCMNYNIGHGQVSHGNLRLKILNHQQPQLRFPNCSLACACVTCGMCMCSLACACSEIELQTLARAQLSLYRVLAAARCSLACAWAQLSLYRVLAQARVVIRFMSAVARACTSASPGCHKVYVRCGMRMNICLAWKSEAKSGGNGLALELQTRDKLSIAELEHWPNHISSLDFRTYGTTQVQVVIKLEASFGRDGFAIACVGCGMACACIVGKWRSMVSASVFRPGFASESDAESGRNTLALELQTRDNISIAGLQGQRKSTLP
ncbi:hypothetical protein EDD22DRAFT_1054550 [Suillus occidentalis]|nr:hypothetical protein EDD22DRAFT_1054550 [Suillus occidentalis]